MSYSLVFDEFDNPMYLKKVGNWVFTFADADTEHTNLAITYVLPRSVNHGLEIRRVLIEKSVHENHWLIKQIECFDSIQNQEIILIDDYTNALDMLTCMLKEFEKYDVCIQLKKHYI